MFRIWAIGKTRDTYDAQFSLLNFESKDIISVTM
jgi:hypothetical protein